MRDYPTVPNVFRVASSHYVDTDCATVATVSASGCDIKITSGTNANLPTGQLRQQQQKQPNGNISGQQQSLVKSFISSQTTTTATTALPTTAANTKSSTLSSTTILKSSTSQQQQQQPTKNDVDFIMHNHNSLHRQQQQQHQHKLTTHASIEQPHCLRSSQLYLHHSPYATLPRNIPASQSTLSLLSPTNNTVSTEGDLSKQQQQQHQKQQYNHNYTTNSNNNDNGNDKGNSISSNEPTMLGVINTISGSIPATGYTMDPLATTKSNGNTSGGGGAIAHRTISIGSDLNMAMNNSCTNLSKLNGIQQQHQHKQQQQKHLRLQQQKQSTHHQSDFKQQPTNATTTIDDFTTYRRQYPCSSLERNTNGYLWIITPVAASISVAIVIAALAGPQWLFTEEKLPNTLYNGTANFNVLDDGAFITRYTKSSLWIICTMLQGVETYSCIKIDYFSEKGYQPDPHDSASAIPYTVTKSCPFFLASGIVLLLSFIVFLIPTCSHQNNLYYFSAGIMFIVSGLLMLIGLIAYISILKAEIGSKLRPRSTLQPPLFKVTYGQSFFLFVFGFIATEFVGVLNIFLYISLQEVGYYSRLPCFTISNLQEKIKEGENRLNTHTYKSYKHEIESKKPIDRKRNQQNRKHQVVAQELELNTKNLLKNMTQANGKSGVAVAGRKVIDASTEANAGPYACRKHPNGLGSTMMLNELDRRYYFEKPSTSNSTHSKCNLHSKNLAKSLNELYTQEMTSSAFLPPPPPPSAIRASMQLQTHTLPRPPQQFSDSPQGFPLTRSVSTTTDIYASQNVTFSKSMTKKANNGEFGSGGSRRRNAATNTGCKADNETQTNGGGGQQNNNIANSKKIQQPQLQQQQQKNNQLHNNIYKANYATSYANNEGDNDLVGEFIDKHLQRRHQRTVLDAKNAHNDDNHHHNNNNKNNKTNGEDDDDDDVDDEVQPQKLCGLKRSIRKTKDELFEEFCKRAGVRPKPKNIYYIEKHDDDDNDDDDNGNNVNYGNDDDDDNDGDNDNDDGVVDNTLATASVEDNSNHLSNEIENVMQRKPQRLNNSLRRGIANSHTMHNDVLENQHQHKLQQQHAAGEFRGTENNRLYRDAAVEVVDIDEDVDENGFKKLTENEDHLYVIDDNIHLMPQLTRNGRRASMFVEPNHLRRLNSNLSLHAIYAPAISRTGLQKSLYDLETTGNEFDFIAAQQQQHHQPHYIIRDTYGGSQQRLHQDYHQHAGYQSRTLPRAYLKRNADSQDSVTSMGLNTSSTQLHNMYSASQQRLSILAMQHQQQQQQQQRQQNRYISMSREQELYNSRYALHKSNEELNRHYMQQQQQQQQQPIYIQTHQLQQYQQQQQQHHANVPSTNYGTTTTLKQAPSQVQWPAAIPSSPSNFSGSFRMFGPANNGETQNSNTNHHPPLTRSSSSNTSAAAGGHLLNGSSNGSQGPPKFQRAYAFDEPRRTSAVLADAFDLDEIERERRRSHASLFSGLGINATTVNSKASVMGGTVGVGSSKNQDHYDMINGTAV